MKIESAIETPRLMLRSYADGDRDFCISIWCDAVNGRYMADPLLANVDAKYLACFDGMADDPDGYYLVAERKADHRPVGTFCLFPENGNYDIGYCVSKDHWREGLGTEMIAAALRWIRDRGGRSVSAEVADANAASRALLRKFGFSEGRKTRFKKWNQETCWRTLFQTALG